MLFIKDQMSKKHEGITLTGEKYSEKNIPLFHFVYQKSHTD
jgi:hypothetical protein